MKRNKILIAMMVIAVLCTGVLFAGGQQDAAPAADTTSSDAPAQVKVAMLMSGPINDGGWNTSAYEGLTRLRDELGFEIAYTEMVPQSQQKSILRNYAQRGYDLVIGHGFEFGDSIMEVAPEFPDVKFYQVGGEVQADNVGSGVFGLGELSYLAGKLSAKFTKTNKIGFIGAMEIPTTLAEIDMLRETIAEVNPKASFTVAYTGSWTDVNKGKEAALAQIANGVDVIVAIGDACDVGAIQAAKERGAYVIGWSGDFNSLAPDIVLTSMVQSVPDMILMQGKMLKEGNWKGMSKVWGIADGVEYPGTWSKVVPAELKDEVMADFEAMKAGTLHKRVN
ncbi:BMP family protein [Sediminispirochaeta smaragdinae]|uniref:Basic membrane lipoprotein n=1 Tax=Sediminispirochaeta smaragdinae (strain DSM 11293 / JCM 15392 / SEBR 4228) TaxID=573413 RepID=E1R8M1_SEDSS|nr:BMP family protein [Sediminispirochaeta smaragdinae]ADK81778.1 basic membrane lipoprotein [Sediminispirochaeta smaragdinae DSM 11293]